MGGIQVDTFTYSAQNQRKSRVAFVDIETDIGEEKRLLANETNVSYVYDIDRSISTLGRWPPCYPTKPSWEELMVKHPIPMDHNRFWSTLFGFEGSCGRGTKGCCHMEETEIVTPELRTRYIEKLQHLKAQHSGVAHLEAKDYSSHRICFAMVYERCKQTVHISRLCDRYNNVHNTLSWIL